METNESSSVVRKIYLLEQGQALKREDQILDFDPYKSKISIKDIEKVLTPFGFEKDSTFQDFPSYKSKNLEIAVPLNNIDDYYENPDPAISKEKFLDLAHLIIVNVIEEDSHNDEIVKKLEDIFNLRAYQTEKEKGEESEEK